MHTGYPLPINPPPINPPSTKSSACKHYLTNIPEIFSNHNPCLPSYLLFLLPPSSNRLPPCLLHRRNRIINLPCLPLRWSLPLGLQRRQLLRFLLSFRLCRSEFGSWVLRRLLTVVFA